MEPRSRKVFCSSQLARVREHSAGLACDDVPLLQHFKKDNTLDGRLLLAKSKEMDKQLATTQVEEILEQPDIIASEAS